MIYPPDPAMAPVFIPEKRVEVVVNIIGYAVMHKGNIEEYATERDAFRRRDELINEENTRAMVIPIVDVRVVNGDDDE